MKGDTYRVFIVPCESLMNDKLKLFIEKQDDHRRMYRDQFWIHTTSRFFYLEAFMYKFHVDNVFHIENDVMLYSNLQEMYNNIQKLQPLDTKIATLQDSPNRAICSLVFIPNTQAISDFTDYVLLQFDGNVQITMNDMTLMGNYHNKITLPESPLHPLAKQFGVFDAASIGQYLGGVDFKNIPKEMIINPFINPTKGFVNETSIFKPNTVQYYKSRINNNDNYNNIKYFIGDKQSNLPINQLHIHSKQLYLFSSKFDIGIDEIITGDNILTLCDYVITDQYNLHFHKNIQNYVDDSQIVLIKNWSNINIDALNNILLESKKDTITLFLYADHVLLFTQHILPFLTENLKYVLYIHNGDKPFETNDILNDDKIKTVFAQNPTLNHKKLRLLPIGIARSMWPHGDLYTLFSTMTSTYWRKKTNGLYVNLNTDTYAFRKDVISKLMANEYTIDGPVNYKEYLSKLGQHRFALCVRGNGIDTHRFWESLYLGVIPVIVNDGTHDAFIEHLNVIKIPYYLVENLEFFDTHKNTFFNEELFKQILEKYDIQSVQALECIKLKFYIDKHNQE
jgi:hypothetical protein